MFNFLALLDIRVFGHLSPLWLLIGLALFTARLVLFNISLLFSKTDYIIIKIIKLKGFTSTVL